MTTIESTEYNESPINEIPKDEIIKLTAIAASFKKKPLGIKIQYDNICFDEFITDTNYNPRPIFKRASEFANQKIELVCEDFFTEESVKRISPDSWEIQHEFITMGLCVHFYTKYVQDDSEHEDYAVQRAVVSIYARYDINNMYRYHKYSTDAFRQMNLFYAALQNALM